MGRALRAREAALVEQSLQVAVTDCDTTAMDDASDVLMSEANAISDACMTGSVGYSIGGSDDGEDNRKASGGASSVDAPLQNDQPHKAQPRTRLQDISNERSASLAQGEQPGLNPAGQGCAHSEQSSIATVSQDAVVERAMKVVTSDPSGPTASGEPPISKKACVEDCVLIKAAVNVVFNQHGNCICRSGERPDLPLSREEAYGHVAVDLFLGTVELLTEEPRQIGKRVDNHATREHRSHENVKGNAKDKRKNARAAARKDTAKAAVLEQTIEQIDAWVENKRTERLAKLVDLELPDPKSVVVERAAPCVAPPEDPLLALIREGMLTIEHLQREAEEIKVAYEGAKAKTRRLMQRASKMPGPPAKVTGSRGRAAGEQWVEKQSAMLEELHEAKDREHLYYAALEENQEKLLAVAEEVESAEVRLRDRARESRDASAAVQNALEKALLEREAIASRLAAVEAAEAAQQAGAAIAVGIPVAEGAAEGVPV